MEKSTEKLILEKLLHIESDIKEIKTDLTEVKADLTEVKEDIRVIKRTISSIAVTYETYETLLGKNMIEVEKMKDKLKHLKQ